MDQKASLITSSDLARKLQVKAHTVKEWTRRGLIPSLRVTPKVIRYDFNQVIEAIAKKQLRGGSQ